MKRQLHIIVLCEGRRDWSFIRNYLKQRGYDTTRNTRVIFPSDSHEGAGDKYITDNFMPNIRYIRAYSAKNASESRWLLVHTDADTNTVDYRYSMLNNQLPQNEQLCDRDPVCLIIPKRHTETWVYYLLNPDESVTENDIYKTKITDEEVKEAGKQLGLSDPTIKDNCPSSLIRSYNELKRLPG